MAPERLQATLMAAFCAVPPILMSVVVVGQSLQVVRGRLDRNQYFGIRTPSTMRSDRAWVVGHRAALRLMPMYLLVTAATCGTLFASVLYASRTIIVLVGIVGFAAVMALSIYTAVIASRAARSADGQPGDQERH